jgi:hypothetical protein
MVSATLAAIMKLWFEMTRAECVLIAKPPELAYMLDANNKDTMM